MNRARASTLVAGIFAGALVAALGACGGGETDRIGAAGMNGRPGSGASGAGGGGGSGANGGGVSGAGASGGGASGAGASGGGASGAGAGAGGTGGTSGGGASGGGASGAGAGAGGTGGTSGGGASGAGAGGAGGMGGTSGGGAGGMGGAGAGGVGGMGGAGAGGANIVPSLAHCTSANVMDRTSDAIVDVVSVGFSYSPGCIVVKVGTTVNFEQSSFHPLRGMVLHGTTPNPIHAAEADPDLVPVAAVTFDAPGAYGFWCLTHGIDAGPGLCGMAGAVYVVP